MAPKIWRDKTHPGGGKNTKQSDLTEGGKPDTPELDIQRDRSRDYEPSAYGEAGDSGTTHLRHRKTDIDETR